MAVVLRIPKEFEPYGWYVGITDDRNSYLRQDLTIQHEVRPRDKENGGYFVSETEAMIARDAFYEKQRKQLKEETMARTVNLEDVIGDALHNIADSTNGCGCTDIDKENKFLGQVFDHNGNYIETLHAEDKKEFKEYLGNPDNMGRRVLVYKGVLAYSSDVPVNTHKLPKSKKK